MYLSYQSPPITSMHSFIAIFNKSGIACASSHDRTIYKLSRTSPIAVAVNPESRIDWHSIIDEYVRRVDTDIPEFINGYIDSFDLYLSSLEIAMPERFDGSDELLTFMGFGREELYPSVVQAIVRRNDDGRIALDYEMLRFCSHNETVTAGDFSAISPLLYGSTDDFRQMMVDNHVRMMNEYSGRIMEKVAGTEKEGTMRAVIDGRDFNAEAEAIMEATDNRYGSQVSMGLCTFSVEDLVSSVETLVNANVRLSCLRSGSGRPESTVKEIAVLTLPEGLTWIKHSLFAV